jgi:sulfur dioxygenase
MHMLVRTPKTEECDA